jgi:hypothetical protein
MKFTNMRRSGPLHVDLCGETPSSRAVNHVYRPSFSVTHFRSTATGAALTWVSITLPPSRRMRVGIVSTSNRLLKPRRLVGIDLDQLQPARKFTSKLLQDRTHHRQGPHQGAHMSTSTGMVEASTMSAKLASDPFTTQCRGVWHFPQRGTPCATAGTRFLV